ncbi:putative disease resistance RPP13-like protein 3 isoform X2 [Setaria italica]|uniref:putative disease resistance RPP13-like protein 3 isoform X2 n=1 Tax=Setaria italica TaxID=4555 RepID=UPI00035090FC|nr:putative disease resistance RPP13-like protein 3 isoform X2 [Setaria italica]
MAEKILVSASVGVMNSLLGKLATLMGEKYAKLKDVRKQVAFLHEELSSMAALLEDLADMEDLDNKTKQWRNKVREMSYDIEDCIDEFMHRVGGSCDGKGLLRRLKTLRARHQLANQIQELKIRVQEASARRMRYKLDDCKTRSGGVAVDPRISALYAESSRLVGIDGPKEEVINLLEKQVDDASVQELRVVSIVGFGGLGKTTLANEVYKNFGESFACKAFVSVSQRPDMVVLLKSLVTQILGRGTDICEVNGLIDSLRKYLQDKRYLVVVDDLWDASAWEIIKCAFPEGHYGSKVLTTTRIERVAVTCCNFQWEFVYRMKPLDNHSSRQLFYGRVFGLENTCPHPFEEPSEKILQKCGGLPLAIISIASLLASQSNRSVSQWNCVLNSLRSDLRSNPTLEGMRQILNLSYTHLPHHLKTCLLYIGMYPEDHHIKKDHLVMQWVAEGFVCGIDGRDALEIAGSYFNELVNRSMIIQLVEDRALRRERIYHKVHDMVLDLIVSKSAEENFLCVVENIETVTRRQHCKTRRLSLQLGEAELDKIAPRMSLTHVRSLCISGLRHRSIELSELKFIRVLFVCKVDGLDLTPIGKLFQLRYLNVTSYLELSMQLPKQICGLHHLETLVIGGLLSELPHDIVDLPALSYLKVSVWMAYPDGISKMKSLRTLKGFDPSKQSVDNLRALGELLNLRELRMCFTDDSFPAMETHKDALFYSIQKLLNGNLRHFTVSSLDQRHTGYYDGWNSLCLSDCRLEQLHLQFQFPRLPMWVGQLSTLSNLEIRVDKLSKDDISVLAGLPALAHLVLWARDVPDEVIVFSSSAAFRSLDYFESRAGLAFHFQAGAVPKLETLVFQLRVGLVKTCGIRLAGVEHLTNLKRVAIGLSYASNSISEVSDVPKVDAAIRAFFDGHHPGRPGIYITRYLYPSDDD